MTVRFMMDDLRASNGGFPLPADADTVKTYLDTVRPVTVKDLFVEPPIPFPVNVRIAWLNPDTAATHGVSDQDTTYSAPMCSELDEKRRPLAIDLFCGLGGWTEGLLAEGYDVIGFDIERHVYGEHRYPALLVIQDVLTLHGSQFRDAALIVASPPCQAYSWRAMPWKAAKAAPPPDNTLFDACFRIQREACEAAGRHVPLVVENVRGAQKWVGRARWNHGPYALWGDVPALMPSSIGIRKGAGTGRIWFYQNGGNGRSASSCSLERKEWSAKVAKIPLELARHIAATFRQPPT
jgi:hypothetical protein